MNRKNGLFHPVSGETGLFFVDRGKTKQYHVKGFEKNSV